jgi:hypothetical protein
LAYEQKPGDLAIFREKDKRNDKAPDWKGTLITRSGEKLAVALWIKSDTMLAGKVEEPRQRTDTGSETRTQPPEQPRAFDADLNDEIPF